MSETILQDFTISLIAMTEMEIDQTSLSSITLSRSSVCEDSGIASINKSAEKLEDFISSVSRNIPPPSESSRSWLEMILVETSLRNRDRFSLLWPHISSHYGRTLGRLGPTSTPDAIIKFNYTTERRVVGIFKIATRMLARKKVSSSLLDLLGSFFASSVERNAQALEKGTDGMKCPQPLPEELLLEVAGQVAAGMFRLLTLNVSVLPVLTLEQWQILFDILSVTASAGGFASIKSFESMAWLLHEPRLRAEVPVFCVVAIKPLLRNPNAPISVSIGAVQLLSHLHTRLEVLVKDENEVDMGYDNSDTPVLWESCWAPILRAIAEGVGDGRHSVRVAAVDALSMAILDRHIMAVPAPVMIKILQDIVVPTSHLLGEILLSMPAGKSAGNDSNHGEQVLQEVLRGDSESRRSRSSSNGAFSTESEAYEKEESNLPEGVLTRALSNVTPTRELEVGPAMECLSALCQVFLQQLKKLAPQPSFEELWLSILDLLSFFLLSPENGGKFDKAVLSKSSETASTIDKCYDHLRNILHGLATAGLFDSCHMERWMNTYDKIVLLNRGSRVFVEIFEDCRRDVPPVVRMQW